MKSVFGYIRVSTPKQGKGVSLQEQQSAIVTYAKRHNLKIIQWFEEKKTAGKSGRPGFNAMMKALHKRKADGVIIHKIDRSARNLKDWAALGDLNDAGIEVHFVQESLDLNGRSSRLSADILAVVAADMIRNQRDETKKGLYGRLKQGIYPFRAPVGYVDNGRGELKTVDPIKGPLIKKLFEMYATGRYSARMLIDEADRVGLTNANGHPITMNGIFTMLRNPFYMGIMQVKGKSYPGIHESIIPPSLFQQVQNTLKGKKVIRKVQHDFTYRRMVRCSKCNYALIPERQRGHVYYRCHTETCPTTSIKETRLEKGLNQYLEKAKLPPSAITGLYAIHHEERKNDKQRNKKLSRSLDGQISLVDQRIERLMDALLDEVIDDQAYEKRRTKLLHQKRAIEERRSNIVAGIDGIGQRMEYFLEQLKSLKNHYNLLETAEKREMVKITTSNIVSDGYIVEISMRSPFAEMINYMGVPVCDHYSSTYRINTRDFEEQPGNSHLDKALKYSQKDLELFYQYIRIAARQDQED